MTDNDPSERHAERWRVRSRRLAFDAEPWLRVWHDDLLLPDGREVPGFLGLEMPDYAVVMAVTPDGRVVAERGYKHGPGRVCLTLPAGYINPGEEPLDAAQRELREETGFVAERWERLGAFTNDGNRGGGSGHLFLAHGARQTVEPDDGDLETIRVELLPLDSLLDDVTRGEFAMIANAAAIALALLHLAGEKHAREPGS